MFEKIKEWFLRGIDKMLSKSTIEEALKVKTAISNEMDRAMGLWLKIFTNNAPWLNEEVTSLQLGASIAEEFARLITLEMKSEVTGSARANYINEYYQKVLEDLKSKLALFNAVGGGFFKPYVKNNRFYIDYIPQTDCKPLKFDNAGNITSMAFNSQITKGDKIYTRLETHTLNGTDYIIENKVYVSDNSSMLGRITSLSEVIEWSELEERTVIKNIERPLFAYYKVPLANNIDTKSCLGPSVYHKAVDSIRKADIQASRLDYEYESAERSIYADIDALRHEESTAKRCKIVKTLDAGDKTSDFYREFSPQLRDEGFIRGQNKIKQEIEFQCNLAYGTISDPNTVDKTATEINASKQRSYASVSQMQKSLEYALKHLVKILDVYCDLYELAPSGECEVSAEWDDSIIVDTESEQRIRLQETNLGLGSKLDYLCWRYRAY